MDSEDEFDQGAPGGRPPDMLDAFEVALDANKIEIRKAIEALFKVDVLCVRTSIVRGKNKRVGRRFGRRPNWKKAVITLPKGQEIDVFEGV